jgi:UTP-glucose-1-phosphate uridylyltransferase
MSEGFRNIQFRNARIKKLIIQPIKNHVAEQLEVVFRVDQIAAAGLGRAFVTAEEFVGYAIKTRIGGTDV